MTSGSSPITSDSSNVNTVAGGPGGVNITGGNTVGNTIGNTVAGNTAGNTTGQTNGNSNGNTVLFP